MTPVLVFTNIASSWNLDTLMLTGAKYYTPKNLIILLLITIRGLAGLGTSSGSCKSSNKKTYTLLLYYKTVKSLPFAIETPVTKSAPTPE